MVKKAGAVPEMRIVGDETQRGHITGPAARHVTVEAPATVHVFELSTDLHHRASASGVGAELVGDAIPCSEAARSSGDPIASAMEDGEDFELLFTVPAGKVDRFVSAWSETQEPNCSRIGTVTPGNTIECLDADGNRSMLNATGYDHFSGGRRQS